MPRSAWPSGIRGAILRLFLLLVGASALVLFVAVPLGLAAHTSLNRAISLGFYGVGGFLTALGLLAGNRGPFRRADEEAPTLSLDRNLRRATLDELLESINVSVVMVTIGLVLCAIGVAIDDRYSLI